MKTTKYIISICLLCTCYSLTLAHAISTTYDSIISDSTASYTSFKDSIQPCQSDSLPYKMEPDTAMNYLRSGNPILLPDDSLILLFGNSFELPFGAGSHSSDFSYSNTRNTSEFSNNCIGRSTNDVFYRFILTVPMNVTMTHQGSVVDDTYMYLLDSIGNLIVSNDDYRGEGHCSNVHNSFIRRQLDAGTYYVVSEGNTLNGYITTNIIGNTAGGFNYPSIPSTYSSEPGTAVGAMGGQFGVSAMGGATYSIPIEIPQGVGGLQPQLSIVYNSQSGNGLCGYGASLTGISAITRGPKDIYHDGAAQGMKYLADDAFYLDGVRLILSSGTAGQNGAVYHPESDPFTTVTVHNNYNVSNNTMYFEVQSSDGMTYHYGDSANSRLTYTAANGDQRIHSWYIRRVQQPTGNYITYSYLDPSNNNYCVYPYRITYGNNASHSNPLSNVIEFVYQDRSDSVSIRFDGKQGSMARRLRTITCKSGTTTYRKYTLNYDTTGDGTAFKFSRLTSVTGQNGQNESLPATLFEWSHLPTVSYSATNMNSHFNEPDSPTVSIENQKFGSCDLNGDGMDDILGYGKTNSNNDRKIYIYKYLSSRTNNGISFTVDHQYSFNTSYSEVSGDVSDELIQELKSSTLGGSAVIDYDGDGRNEYLIGRIFKTYDMNANGSSTLNKYMEFFMLREEDSYNYSRTRLITDCTPLYSTGDIDNDGRSDLIILETQSYDDIFVKLHILSASVNSAEYTYDYTNLPVSNSVDYDLHLPYTPRQLFVADMNGNGLQDLLVIYANGYSVFWNRGGNITESNLMYNGNVSDYFHYGQGLNNYYAIAPGDFNGDGLIDFLTKESQYWCFNLNKGDGSFYKTNCTSSLLNTSVSNSHCDIIDFDHDGKSDAIITETTHYPMMSAPFEKTYTRWLRSTGTSLEQVYYATSNRQDDALSTRYITGDFNGDGMSELINYGYDCVSGNNANSDPVWYIYCNNSLTMQSGKVTSVTGDFGTTTSITYSTLADNSVYTRGTTESYPAPRYTIPLNVVKQTVQDNGASGNLTTKYTYEGLKAHLSGRGLLGFCKTTSNCTSTGVKTESGILQWDTIHYIPKVTYSLNTIGGDTSRTTITLTIEDKGQRKYFAYPSQTITTDMDGVITTTYRSYNKEKGYITSDSTVYASNMYRSVSYRDYTPNKVGGAYRPQTVVQSQFHSDPNNTPFSRTTKYTYNSNGTVYTKVENYGSSMPLTTSYGYDQYGNITSQESTGSNITPCTTYYQYDATHRFPVRIYTNPASSVKKYTYDQWGHVLTERDSINSNIDLIDSLNYDNWGFLIRKRYADGSENTWTRGWNNDAAQRWYVLEQGTARPWIKTWYDNRGREVKTESVSLDNISVVENTLYNTKGQLETRTTITGDLNHSRNYQYDSRGRIQRVTGSEGVDITHSYGTQGGGTRTEIVTEAVNDGELTTTYVYDAWGNLKSVTDPVSSVSNDYSSNGGIKQITSERVKWTFIYDDCDNRTMMIDPDADTTWYVFDALGREIRRKDARDIEIVTNYDYLGRVTQCSAGSSTISYTYGTSGNGQMSLISESDGTWTKSYTYDNLGRVTGETMSKGNTFSMIRGYTYGSNGLLSSADMPGGKTCTYTYDAYGNLTGLDFNSGTITWSLTGYTGRRATSQTVLNGSTSYPFVKTVQLDQYGYLDSLVTLQNGCTYQEEKYTFDPIRGNLNYKNNRNYDYPFNYYYDNADRLITVKENNQDIMSVTYSANGNISSKTGIGNYTYGNQSKPHAVMMVQNSGGLINMNTQELGFNGWNRLTSVWQTDDHNFYSYSIDYGPDLKRVTSEMHKTYQKQYEKFYWDDYEEKYVGNDTLRYWYIYTPGGLEGLYIEKSTPNGMTSHTTKVITDHLGSIESLIDNGDWVYDVSYDAWGKREVLLPYWFDPTFDRGYCGHEHIDELGLINMNGRMYDPLLGRFLSPDPYVQSPTNPQNYNRYSYCLNNPLRYTDPSGEIFGVAFGLLSDLIDNTFRLIKGDKLDWTQTKWGLMIDLGLFVTDGNKSDGAQAWELVSRFIWQTPQIVLGDFLASAFNAFGKVNEVSYGYGMTALDMGMKDGDAVTLGYLTAGPNGYRADWRDHTFVHEYGHYVQSQQHGPLFLMTVGLPSLQSAILQTKNLDSPRHRNRWFEADASYKGAEYFDKYYGTGKVGYDSNSEYYFDKNSFKTGDESLYTNPSTNVKNDRSHPTSAIFHWTDIIIYFPVIGLIPWFRYR